MLREEILRSAEALLVETGTEDALTLRAVAARVAVTTPSVYRHFADKDALVEAVCLRVWDELGARMSESAAAVEDPLRALGRCGRVYAHFALDHPIQYRLLMMRPTAGRLPPASTALFRHVIDAVTACTNSGILRGDPEILAVGLWSALHGLVSLLITQPDFPWLDDLDALIEHTVRMAGFGSALACRLPRDNNASSAEFAAELDTLADRLTIVKP
jgi:AcrR family transcriptional regulator